MAKLIIFDSVDEKKIRELQASKVYYGWAYIIEYMSGKVKIGATGNLERRMKDLKHWCCEYGEAEFGRIAVTEDCTNHYEIERKLHEIFSEYREGKNEKFNICFDEVVSRIKEMDLSFKYEKPIVKESSSSNDNDWVDDFIRFISSMHEEQEYRNAHQELSQNVPLEVFQLFSECKEIDSVNEFYLFMDKAGRVLEENYSERGAIKRLAFSTLLYIMARNSFQKDEYDSIRSDFYIKNNGKKFYIKEYNIFTRCPECGKEINVDVDFYLSFYHLMDEKSECGIEPFENFLLCEECQAAHMDKEIVNS